PPASPGESPPTCCTRSLTVRPRRSTRPATTWTPCGSGPATRSPPSTTCGRRSCSEVLLSGRRRGAPQARAPAEEEGRDRRRVGRRVERQQHRRARNLAEVEVGRQVAEQRQILAHAGPGVGAAVGGGVEPGAAEEVVLDELQVGVAAERLVVDVALPGVGGD